MDIKHVLSCNPLAARLRRGRRAARRRTTPACGGSSTPAALVEIGHAGAGSASTTSRPATAVHLEPFALADRPVTCGEWMAFMDDGGYHRPELWLSDGWATVQAERLGGPALLVTEADGDWWRVHPGRRRTGRPGRARLPRELLRGRRLRPLGRRAAADRVRVGGWRAAGRAGRGPLPRPDRAPPVARRRRRPATCSATSGSGPSSAYSPYPGFRPAAGAVGEYNGKFMVNQYVLRGGSCVTPPGHVRATYRNFFPPSARWAFTGAATGPRHLSLDDRIAD